MGFVFLRVVLFLPPFSIFLCLGFLMFFDVRGWKSLRVPMQRSSASSISWRQMPSRCHQQPISDRKTNHCHGSHGTPQDLKMCESHSVIKCFLFMVNLFSGQLAPASKIPWLDDLGFSEFPTESDIDLTGWKRRRISCLSSAFGTGAATGCDGLRLFLSAAACCSLAVQPMFGLKDSWADEKLEPRRATPKHRDIQRPI